MTAVLGCWGEAQERRMILLAIVVMHRGSAVLRRCMRD
jgi:hypothetical protein